MVENGEPSPEVGRRLGYLLKHAQLQLADLTAVALEPYGINGREFAVLLVLAGAEPLSQQQAALRLGIDRTTMVALLDSLEDGGLVARRPHGDDRRRNVVQLTRTGKSTLRRAVAAVDEAERTFLAPLDATSAQVLRDSLWTVVVKGDGQPT